VTTGLTDACNPLLEAALGYAARGWRVIPLHNLVEQGKCSCDAWRISKGIDGCHTPGKHPRFSKWAELASTDPRRIRAWWRAEPNANVGVVSGKGSGQIVVDTDPRNGGDWSRGELIQKHGGEWPNSPTCTTGGGGMHEHFRWPAQLQTAQGAIQLADGFEILIEGHNVVMPPSFAHPTGQAYFWDVEPQGELPDAPPWLIAILRERLQIGGGKKPEAGGGTWPTTDIGPILQGCGWMQYCAANAGQLSEPEWYAQLSIVGRCANGEQLAQDLSSPHPGYSSAATSKKLQQALRASGPTTCAKVRHSLGGERFCVACPHTVKSPILLGMPRQRRQHTKLHDSDSGGERSGVSDHPQEVEGLPRICVTSRELRDIADEALAAVQRVNDPPFLFARSGSMVSVRRNEKGRQEIAGVSDAAFRGYLTRAANFYRVGASGGSSACFPPVEVPRDIQALAPACWGLQSLDAVVEAPVLRPDGTILDRPGYDAATQLYYAPDPELKLPVLAESPVRDHIEVGVELINELLSEFPFDGLASKANAFAAALTPIVRPAIDAPCPMALFDAPQAGTGKSLLADSISIIATGRAGEMFSVPRDEDEVRKQITTILLSGAPVVVLDNVTRRLDNADYCKVLTETQHGDRVFRTHQKLVLPAKTVWMATGNNIQLGGDMPRRCYRIRLDAQTSRPFMRTGFRHEDLKAWTRAHRGELLAALLTLARAWYLAGRPKPSLAPLGSYEVWSTTVGGILEFAGVKGFLGNAESVYQEADNEAGQWEGFLQTLDEVFYGEPFTVHQLVERLKVKNRAGESADTCVQAMMLREALPDFLAEGIDREGFFQRRAGKAFAERIERRFGSSQIYLKRGPMTHKVQQWIVVRPAAEPAAVEAAREGAEA
jgi:hypothetical protein